MSERSEYRKIWGSHPPLRCFGGDAPPLGRFKHHPDQAIDFCVEVEELMSIATDRKLGVKNPDDGELEHRVEKAMEFRVGGDLSAVDAKGELRAIDRMLRAGELPRSNSQPSNG